MSKEYDFNKVIGNKNFHLYPHNEDLIISIVYNINHAIELFFKGLIRFGGPIRDEKKENFYTHDIKTLKSLVTKRWGKKIKEDEDLDSKLEKIYENVSDFRESFKKYDKGNMFFRYPERKKKLKLTLYRKDIQRLSTKKKFNKD